MGTAALIARGRRRHARSAARWQGSAHAHRRGSRPGSPRRCACRRTGACAGGAAAAASAIASAHTSASARESAAARAHPSQRRRASERASEHGEHSERARRRDAQLLVVVDLDLLLRAVRGVRDVELHGRSGRRVRRALWHGAPRARAHSRRPKKQNTAASTFRMQFRETSRLSIVLQPSHKTDCGFRSESRAREMGRERRRRVSSPIPIQCVLMMFGHRLLLRYSKRRMNHYLYVKKGIQPEMSSGFLEGFQMRTSHAF